METPGMSIKLRLYAVNKKVGAKRERGGGAQGRAPDLMPSHFTSISSEFPAVRVQAGGVGARACDSPRFMRNGRSGGALWVSRHDVVCE